MKTLKISFYNLLILIGLFSCTKNDEGLIEPMDTNHLERSFMAKTVTEGVKTHVKTDGSFNNPTNPTSSIKFDFGFDFVYPTTLKYNDGTKVVVNDIKELATVVSSMNETNYIDGILFPFTVMKTNDVDMTIRDETDFENLVNSHDTDKDGIPNYTDTDDDNDGAPDAKEDANHDGDVTNDDADNDGIANYQDTDSDNDGQLDKDEDNDGDGDFTNDDSDQDGTPDYNDTDSDNDGTNDGDDADDDNDGTNDTDEHNNDNGDNGDNGNDGDSGDNDNNGDDGDSDSNDNDDSGSNGN